MRRALIKYPIACIWFLWLGEEDIFRWPASRPRRIRERIEFRLLGLYFCLNSICQNQVVEQIRKYCLVFADRSYSVARERESYPRSPYTDGTYSMINNTQVAHILNFNSGMCGERVERETTRINRRKVKPNQIFRRIFFSILFLLVLFASRFILRRIRERSRFQYIRYIPYFVINYITLSTDKRDGIF